MSELIFPLHIRHGDPGDIGAMALTQERAWAQEAGDPLLPSRPTYFCRKLIAMCFAAPNAWSFVAPAEDRLAGFAIGAPIMGGDTRAEPTDYLSFLMVEPDYWGLGLGATLLGAAANDALDCGYQRMSLFTPVKAQRARGLYEHRGFRPTGEQASHSRHGLMMQYIAHLPLRSP